MTDFDITWKNISEAQAAALAYASKCGSAIIRASMHQGEGEWHPPITEFNIAEMICLSKDSLWYIQAKSWAEGVTPYKEGRGAKVVQAFQAAGKVIVALVDKGYSEGVWFDPTQTWEDSTIAALSLASISEACRLLVALERSINVFDILAMESAPLISSWLRSIDRLLQPYVARGRAWKLLETQEGSGVLISEIRASIDPEWRKKHNAAVRKARADSHETYEPTECIHPECHNLVAPSRIKPREGHFKNYRGTGACQQGHNSYYCTKCAAPHSFVSKIGQSHYEKYYGGDYTKEFKHKLELEGAGVWK
jgi:hypothetical protein